MDFGILISSNADKIDKIGDRPNIELKVKPDDFFWKTIKEKDNWLCQSNSITGTARIVSPDHIQVGNGSRTAMLEKMERLSREEFLEPGDVIGVSRVGLYEHYGIYIGNGKVIHYSGGTGDFDEQICIREASLKEFLKESKIYFVVWFDHGIPIKLQKSTCFLFNTTVDVYNQSFQKNKRTIYSNTETIKRAQSRLGEEKYNIATNNCEHFALWCKTGNSESSQVKQILNYLLMAGIALGR